MTLELTLRYFGRKGGRRRDHRDCCCQGKIQGTLTWHVKIVYTCGWNAHTPWASEILPQVKVLTHCNTGSLATARYGTALGVIRYLHAQGKLERAYCTETRPYNQGCRLTAFELVTPSMSLYLCLLYGSFANVFLPCTSLASGSLWRAQVSFHLSLYSPFFCGFLTQM